MYTEMDDENKKEPKSQLDNLYGWISRIPLSKPTKNLTRDVSDAVMIAEILKVYYPRYVDLHNYVPASSLTTKKENWNTLNRKVLSKIDMKLTKNVINQLVNGYPGAAENMLLELRKKVLKDSEPQNSQDLPCNDKEDNSIEEDKINVYKMIATESQNSISSAVDQLTLSTCDYKRSIFVYAIEKFYFVLKWFINCLCIWNCLQNIKTRFKNSFHNSLKEDSEVSRTQGTSENTNEEDAVPRHVCAQLKQELREIDDIICTLNHKVAYLESAMKLKDLRISNLTSQILQNAVESEQFIKIQMNDAQTKLRPRIQNIREKVKVEE